MNTVYGSEYVVIVGLMRNKVIMIAVGFAITRGIETFKK